MRLLACPWGSPWLLPREPGHEDTPRRSLPGGEEPSRSAGSAHGGSSSGSPGDRSLPPWYPARVFSRDRSASDADRDSKNRRASPTGPHAGTRRRPPLTWILFAPLLLLALADLSQELRHSLFDPRAHVSSYHAPAAWDRWSPSLDGLALFLRDVRDVVPPGAAVTFASRPSPGPAQQLRLAWAVYLLPDLCVCGDTYPDPDYRIAYRQVTDQGDRLPILETRDGSVLQVAP